jgi:hypothetical protein
MHNGKEMVVRQTMGSGERHCADMQVAAAPAIIALVRSTRDRTSIPPVLAFASETCRTSSNLCVGTSTGTAVRCC